MKNKPTNYIFFCLITMLLLKINSCTPQGCIEETEAFVKGSFYKTGTGQPQTPDSITLFGLGMDTSMIYDRAQNTPTIMIPLYAGSDTSRFIMKINGFTDTVIFIYTSYPHLVSRECGYSYFHNIDKLTNTLDEVDFLITNRNISTTNEENIRIFY